MLGGFCLNDILIASKTFSEHITHLKKVLQRLQQTGLRVKPSKCAIAEGKVEYLGFVLSSKGVCPTGKNIDAIKLFSRPAMVKEVKQFLGLANFYRRHVRNMGMISEPLIANSFNKERQTI